MQNTFRDYNILKSAYHIPKELNPIPVCCNNSELDAGQFFQGATQCLCGTLEFGGALSSFFQFLRRTMPVTSITVGRILFDKHMAEGFAYCDEKDTFLLNSRVPFGPEEIRMADATFCQRGDTEEGIFARTMDEPYARFLCAINAMIAPPLFYLRMRSEGGFMAGFTFTCRPDRLFTEDDLQKLRSLRAPLLMTLSNCVQYRELTELKEQILHENIQLRRQLGRAPDNEIVGAQGGLTHAISRARLAGATDIPVLISGETGTGKEMIAHAVHGFSHRAGAAFIAVNCGAIPASLIDSELFGHVRGAFTGAVQDHKGYFERAHGGTIFLDEIGELPQDAQTRLLRVLQDGKIERLGGGTPLPVDFRLIAATHRDLRHMVHEGTFREDLFYRLCVVQLSVPPLRERVADIPLLTTHFLQNAAKRLGIVPPIVAPGEMWRVLAYTWPGNVRELRNVVEEALVLMPQGPLHFHLNGMDEAHSVNGFAKESSRAGRGDGGNGVPRLDAMLDRYYRDLLRACDGKINGPDGAAEKAGIKANTLRFRLDKLGIPYGRGARSDQGSPA